MNAFLHWYMDEVSAEGFFFMTVFLVGMGLALLAVLGFMIALFVEAVRR